MLLSMQQQSSGVSAYEAKLISLLLLHLITLVKWLVTGGLTLGVQERGAYRLVCVLRQSSRTRSARRSGRWMPAACM